MARIDFLPTEGQSWVRACQQKILRFYSIVLREEVRLLEELNSSPALGSLHFRKIRIGSVKLDATCTSLGKLQEAEQHQRCGKLANSLGAVLANSRILQDIGVKTLQLEVEFDLQSLERCREHLMTVGVRNVQLLHKKRDSSLTADKHATAIKVKRSSRSAPRQPIWLRSKTICKSSTRCVVTGKENVCYKRFRSLPPLVCRVCLVAWIKFLLTSPFHVCAFNISNKAVPEQDFRTRADCIQWTSRLRDDAHASLASISERYSSLTRNAPELTLTLRARHAQVHGYLHLPGRPHQYPQLPQQQPQRGRQSQNGSGRRVCHRSQPCSYASAANPRADANTRAASEKIREWGEHTVAHRTGQDAAGQGGTWVAVFHLRCYEARLWSYHPGPENAWWFTVLSTHFADTLSGHCDWAGIPAVGTAVPILSRSLAVCVENFLGQHWYCLRIARQQLWSDVKPNLGDPLPPNLPPVLLYPVSYESARVLSTGNWLYIKLYGPL